MEELVKEKLIVTNKYIILVSVLLIGGCASGIKKDIAFQERNIGRENTKISKSQSILRRSGAYQNGTCTFPSYGTPPDPYCDTREKAKKHALAYCSLASGCALTLLAVEDNLSSFEEKYLASEACTAAVNALQDKGYSPDMSVYNAFSAVVDVGCERESQGFFSAIVKGVSCLTAVSIGLERISAYEGCLARTENSCVDKLEKWRDAPEKELNECKINLDIIAEAKNSIADSESVIQEKKSTLAWRLFGNK